MNNNWLILALFCASALAASPYRTKVYRSDYTYNKKTDAFYKLHTESLHTRRAKEKCQAEGAKLMVVVSPQDIQQLHSMFKKFTDLGEYVLVEADNQQHESVEELAIVELESERSGDKPSCEVVSRSGEIESVHCWQSAPFMCKVDAVDAPYDEECDVYGRNYISKVSTSGSCYKVPTIAYAWNEAAAECSAEGAHLVVLNSEVEHEVVWDIMKASTPVPDSKANYFFLAGIRANRPTDGSPRVFRTLMNQTLEEAGYTKWAENEPNNYLDSENCGSLFKNDGKYNDLPCSEEYGFVCEKERQIVGSH